MEAALIFMPKIDCFFFSFNVEDLFTSQSLEASKVVEDSRCLELHRLNRGINPLLSMGVGLSKGRELTCRACSWIPISVRGRVNKCGVPGSA